MTRTRSRLAAAALAGVTTLTTLAGLAATAPAAHAGTSCKNATMKVAASTHPDAVERSRQNAANRFAIELALLCLTNELRAAKGIKPVKSEWHLVDAAEKHSADMVKRTFYGHTNPSGQTEVDRVKAAGYPLTGSWAVGEVINQGAAGTTPQSIMTGWMNSPGHKKIILDPKYVEIGPGMEFGIPQNPSSPGGTFTMVFGRRG